MIQLLESLFRGRLASPVHTSAMLDHLSKCEDRLKVRRLLPAETKVWNKTGSLDRVRCDAGILETGRGAVAYCILNGEQSRHELG